MTPRNVTANGQNFQVILSLLILGDQEWARDEGKAGQAGHFSFGFNRVSPTSPFLRDVCPEVAKEDPR